MSSGGVVKQLPQLAEDNGGFKRTLHHLALVVMPRPFVPAGRQEARHVASHVARAAVAVMVHVAPRHRRHEVMDEHLEIVGTEGHDLARATGSKSLWKSLIVPRHGQHSGNRGKA